MRQSHLCEHMLVLLLLYHNCNHHTVPTSQSDVTVVQSDDNHPRQDDESDRVTNTEGLYMCRIVCGVTLCA